MFYLHVHIINDKFTVSQLLHGGPIGMSLTHSDERHPFPSAGAGRGRRGAQEEQEDQEEVLIINERIIVL